MNEKRKLNKEVCLQCLGLDEYQQKKLGYHEHWDRGDILCCCTGKLCYILPEYAGKNCYYKLEHDLLNQEEYLNE